MKMKNLLLIVLIAISFETFANMQTTGWRWRNDDGDLDNATWMTANDCEPITITSTKTIRLRVRLDNPYGDQDFTTSGLGYGEKETVFFQYENNPLSPKFTGDEDFSIAGNNECFTALGAAEFFEFVSSAYVTDGEYTTSLDVPFTSLKAADAQPTFTPGIFASSNQPYTLPRASHTEIEYCFRPTAKAVNGTYYFLGGGANTLLYPGADKLVKFPELTIALSTGVSDLNGPEAKVLTTSNHIKVYNLPQGNVNVNLYNMMGVLAKTMNANGADGQVNIPTNDLTKGLYIVNVQTVNGKIQKKVMIQ